MMYLRYDIWLTPHDISLRDIMVSLCDKLDKFLKCHFKNTTIAVCRYIICHRHISFIIYHYSNLSYNDKLEFDIDIFSLLCYDTGNLQTVDAGIKAVTPPQRACGAGNQAGNELSNGPRRAQRTGNSVACDAVSLR